MSISADMSASTSATYLYFPSPTTDLSITESDGLYAIFALRSQSRSRTNAVASVVPSLDLSSASKIWRKGQYISFGLNTGDLRQNNCPPPGWSGASFQDSLSSSGLCSFSWRSTSVSGFTGASSFDLVSACVELVDTSPFDPVSICVESVPALNIEGLFRFCPAGRGFF